MHERDKRVLLRRYLEEGLSKAAISRKLGVGLRTVYRWLARGEASREREGEALRYGPRRSVGSILDPYKEVIAARLEEYPELSAVRLFREVRELGYPGGYDQVKRHVLQVRPRPEVEPAVRFETAPGRQGQVDFASVGLPWGRRQVLVVVLGYSRMLWFQSYPRQTMGVLLRGLEAAFAYFGGVPEELLFDQMKSVVLEDRRGSGGGVLRNQEFARFARHWDFRVKVCRPYRAQTKGKVEPADRISEAGVLLRP